MKFLTCLFISQLSNLTLIFAYDVPKVLNELLGDIFSATMLLVFHEDESLSLHKMPIYPNFYFFPIVSVVWIALLSF